MLLTIVLTAGFLLCNLQTSQGCEPWEWRCKTAGCVTLKSRCNGEYECTDQSDEDFCDLDRSNHELTTFSAESCPDGTFQCNNRKCYYTEWHCDGTKDCDDGTDERNCPGLGDSLMPTSSIIGMSVTVGGLFLLLIGIIVMITCVRRKHGDRLSRRMGVNETLYPGNTPTPSAIACPTISGEIVLREPPPRYTSQPDMYYSRSALPTAAVNLGFSPDEPQARPPPCYSSHPNLVNDFSNISLCSSVEPPPSYTSQQDHNMLNSTIGGAINLSFCPDESDICPNAYAGNRVGNRSMNSSFFSVHSMKSWADNLDSDTVSLGSQINEREYNAPEHHRRKPVDSHPRYKSTERPPGMNSSQSVNTFDKSPFARYPGAGYTCSAKILSKVQRAKALGRQYSSTPMLTDSISPTVFNRRVSIDTGDTENNDRKFPLDATYPHPTDVGRRVKSAVQLDQKNESGTSTSLEAEPNKAESTTCCNSRQYNVKHTSGSQGLRFWRNNSASLGTCPSRSEESDEGFQEEVSSHTGNTPPKSLHRCATQMPSEEMMNSSLSHLYLSDFNSLGSNNSINSWMC